MFVLMLSLRMKNTTTAGDVSTSHQKYLVLKDLRAGPRSLEWVLEVLVEVSVVLEELMRRSSEFLKVLGTYVINQGQLNLLLQTFHRSSSSHLPSLDVCLRRYFITWMTENLHKHVVQEESGVSVKAFLLSVLQSQKQR